MSLHKFVVSLLIAASLSLGSLVPAFAAPSQTPPATHKVAKPLQSKHQAWSQAVTMLEKTKKLLQADKAKDIGGHKAKALLHIQQAMQELRAGTQGAKH